MSSQIQVSGKSARTVGSSVVTCTLFLEFVLGFLAFLAFLAFLMIGLPRGAAEFTRGAALLRLRLREELQPPRRREENDWRLRAVFHKRMTT